MAAIASHGPAEQIELRPAQREPWWIRWLLIGGALLVLTVLLLLPLFTVFAEALRRGWEVYISALSEPDAKSALKLTLTVAAIVVPLNVVIGLAAAWLVTRFDFRARVC
jgi:sulfate transport system permease protein